MRTETMIQSLRLVAEKESNKRVMDGQTNIRDMCLDTARRLEELHTENIKLRDKINGLRKIEDGKDTFDWAFSMMLNGTPMKLPSWSGYWCWEPNKRTIMMHYAPVNETEDVGPIIDIRETDDVAHTIGNALSGQWEIATEDNCRVLKYENNKPLTFDVGKYYMHATGYKMHIIGITYNSEMYGKPCLIAEDQYGEFKPVGTEPDHAVNFREITKDEFLLGTSK